MAVTELTIGRSGSGKSAYVVRKLVTEWLPFAHNRYFFTNLPLNIDEIIKYYIKEYPDQCSSVALEKIKIIPKDITDKWMTEESGPWEYFDNVDVDASRICIDEIHNFVHAKSKQDTVHKWRLLLGELRHRGCQFEGLSQYETKISPFIRHEAGLRRSLINFEDVRDKLFWVKYYDHFQLKAKAMGYWSSRIWWEEFTPGSNQKWTKSGGGSMPLVPKFYNLYNSFSAPIQGRSQGAKLSPHPYARMGWGELLWWYLSRNGLQIIFFGIGYCLLIWLFAFNGITSVAQAVIEDVTKKTTAQHTTNKPELVTNKPNNEKSTNEPVPAPVVPVPAIFTKHGVFDAHGNRLPAEAIR